MLCTRECGLYKAADLLLGDHLYEKSDTVKWVDVRMLDNRNRRLKDHKELVIMVFADPDSSDIFKENLHSNFYPNKPKQLEDMCLHDFLANYDFYGKDANGNRNYRQLTKSRLVNHKIFDPEKENETKVILLPPPLCALQR